MKVLYFFGETPPNDLLTLAFCAGVPMKCFSPSNKADKWAFDMYGVSAVPHVRVVQSQWGVSGNSIALPKLREALGLLELPLEVGGC